MESIIYANQELILIPAERKEIQLTRGQVDKGTRGCAMLLCRMALVPLSTCPLVN